MRKIDFEKLKVGDTVYSTTGKGIVTGITDHDIYPIDVDYGDNGQYEICYTKEGKLYETDELPSIYLDPISFGFEERVMELSNDQCFWVKETVYGKVKEGYLVKRNNDCYEFYVTFPHAREIQEEKKRVTLELTDEQIDSLKKQGIL